MKFSTTILLFFGCFFYALAQNNPQKSTGCKTLEIQEITLQDTFLIKQLGLFMEEAIAVDSSFANRGYLQLSISKSPYKNEEVQRSYEIGKQFYNLDDLENDLSFPSFYTFIKGKIVLIEINILGNSVCLQYSTKSKRAFQKKLEPFLAKKVRMKFPNKDGKLVTVNNFRPGEVIQLHGGKTIYIFADKNKPPVIVRNIY